MSPETGHARLPPNQQTIMATHHVAWFAHACRIEHVLHSLPASPLALPSVRPECALYPPAPLPSTYFYLPHIFACTESLHVSKPTWWLESRFHFSFSSYW